MPDLDTLAVVYRPVAQLRRYEGNARTHSAAQVLQIQASMREWGWTSPLLIDEADEIIAGHGRLSAAEAIWKAGGSIRRVPDGEAPCIVLAGLSAEQRRALVLADNQLALNAGWDLDVLKAELLGLKGAGFELGVIGFSADALADLLAPPKGAVGDPDAVPDVQPIEVSVPGDVWLLGDHRLVCGDSTDAAAWDAVMAGEPAHLCWTDPPYNVAYESKLAGKIQNDSMGNEAFRQFLGDAFTLLAAHVRPGGAVYVAHADTEGLNFRAAFTGAGLKLSGCLMWRKDSLVLGRSDYQWIHEPILYGWKPGASHRWFGGRKQTTAIDIGAGLPIRQRADGSWLVEVGDQVLVIEGEAHLEVGPGTVLTHPKPKRSAEHPTMKPPALIERMLVNSGKPGDIVVDPFGGSGSTMIAAAERGMRARLIELDPKFADVIVRRWEGYSGVPARLEADGRSFAEVAAGR